LVTGGISYRLDVAVGDGHERDPDDQGRAVVIVPDPQEAPRTLGAEPGGFQPTMPAGIDDGSPQLNRGLAQVLNALGGLNVRIAAFTAARRPDPIRADALAAVIGQAANILDDLATELTAIRNTLEDKAHTASRYGVKIGTDRRPPPLPAGPPADAAAASERYWAVAYRQAFEQATVHARQARQRAAGQLTDLYATIEPPRESLAGTTAGG
jgi:hypothetical protein